MSTDTIAEAEIAPENGNGHGAQAPQGTAALALGAIGVVYGDIGTSPIYALREAMRVVAGQRAPVEAEIVGVLSIILWSLTLIVSVKYAGFVLRADNRGEGGTLSIMALARKHAGRAAPLILFLGMAGSALFYGDAILTPAISVLSAVEGLEVVTPAFKPYVVPLTVAIILALFAVQKYGTARVASVFGPVTCVWFLALAVTGAIHIFDEPRVLAAVNPLEAVRFLIDHSGVALAVLGAAFLAVTGAEALYADLGHFGRRPMVLAWFAVAFPSLVINYFGQGAFILGNGAAVGQPLFEMVPGWATLPMVGLATAATVIASQATITGAYSITRQAIQLQILPRLNVLHTSETQSGQIYMPHVNFMLMAGVLLLVLGFGSSGRLATAYGIAVTGVMLVTAILLFVVIWKVWRKPAWLAAAIVAPFLAIDGVFLFANVQKVADGGWVSILTAGLLLAVMLTWTKGSAILFQKTRRNEVELRVLTGALAAKPPAIVPGVAVFLTSDPEFAPVSLLHSLKHYKVLHQNNVILSVVTAQQPRVPDSERVKIEKLNDLFTRIQLTFGYMEQPNVPKALAICRKQGWKFDIMTTSFFLSRRSLIPAPDSAMPFWQDVIYIWLARNASDATAYFRIPTGRVVEIGAQVVL